MILDNEFPPDPRVENETYTLSKQGHEVFLYCLNYKYNQRGKEKINGIKIYRKKTPKYFFSLSALAYTFPFYHLYFKKSIFDFINKNKIEVIHIHDIQIAKSVFMVNKKFNLPIVLDLHENRPEIMKHYDHVKSKLGKLLINPSIWKKYESKYIQKANKIIVVTKQAKQYYENTLHINNNKIHVVPNSVRETFYTNYKLRREIINQYEDKFVILYIGATGSRRGLMSIVKSLKTIIPKIPNIKIIIVGKVKSNSNLIKYVRKFQFDKYVDFVGWQAPSLFPSYIMASDIGVSPLHKNIHHDTTYANKIFQYLSFGKPIVVSDCKAQEKIVEMYQCGLVFKDRNVIDFSEKILKLHGDKKLYNDSSFNAKKAIKEKLHWGIVSKDLNTLYEQIEKNLKS